MRFAGAGIALHEQARREKFLQIHLERLARRRLAQLDSNPHSVVRRPLPPIDP
jgi:hypothetical protein